MIWNAKLSDGRTVTLEADQQPNEEQVLSALQEYNTSRKAEIQKQSAAIKPTSTLAQLPGVLAEDISRGIPKTEQEYFATAAAQPSATGETALPALGEFSQLIQQLPPAKTAIGRAGESLLKGSVGLAIGGTSPQMVPALLGGGPVSKALFSAMMVKAGIEAPKRIKDILARPGPMTDQDKQEISDAIYEGASSLYLGGRLGTEAGKEMLAKPEVQGPLATGAVLQQPKGAAPLQEAAKAAEPVAPMTAAAVKDQVAQAPEPPEKIVAAAYETPQGKIETGPNHPEILGRLGVTGYETPESRNTLQFGFTTDKGRFISREEAGPIAEKSGQALKDFEPGEPVHSNEVASPKEPERPLSEVGPGMGGALAEGELPEVSGTGLKNAVADLERVGLGLEKAPETQQRNMAEAWVRSGEVEAASPGAGKALADSLIANPERNLTDSDSALLLRHKIDLLNRLNDAAERTHIGDEASRAKAQAEHDGLSVDFNQLLDAIKSRGSEWGREGRWRQAMAQEDFTFTSTDQMKRYHRTITGEDLPADKTEKAGKIAGKVKEATDSSNEADNTVRTYLHGKAPELPESESGTRTKAEQDALNAANKTVRDWAARRAEAENKRRVAKTITERKTAEIQEKEAKKALKAASDVHRKAAVALAKKQRALRAGPMKAVWDEVRRQLDKGENNFNDIRNRVATELGMKVPQVTRLMAQDPRLKRLMDDAWAKQANARLLRQQAKRWVAGVDTGQWEKAFSNIPRFFFGIKVFGHGTVPLGTHAPFVAFQPNYWGKYLPAYKTMYKMVLNKAFYEQQVQDLVRDKNYIPARRGGLVNDPTVYEDYTSPDIAKYISGGQVGTRGFTVLKILRQQMFNQQWDKLPRHLQTDEMAKEIATGVNHDTGVTKAMAPKGLATALFAPRLEGSRVATLVVDPIRAAKILAKTAWGKSTPEERHFAIKQVQSKAYIAATLYGLLKANQAILTAVGSQQKVNTDDPMRSDWMKFKVAGMDFAYGNAMLSLMRMPLSLYRVVSSDGGKTKNLVYADESIATVLFRFGRTQLSPFMGTLVDQGLGADFESRPLPRTAFGLLPQKRPVPKRLRALGFKPYTYPEYWSEQLSPIPGQEAIKEVWRHGFGMSEEQIKALEKALAISSVMAATGGRLTEDLQLKPKGIYFPPETTNAPAQ